jgi:phage baseplate assembly protein W
MTANIPESFLGTGWSFPPTFTPGGMDVIMVSNEEDIHQSLGLLFATSRGERIMQEAYGSKLDEWLFEEMDQDFADTITSSIREAILLHEPRILLLAIDLSQNRRYAGVVDISLDYMIPATNSRFNMVFPFYLNEATTME